MVVIAARNLLWESLKRIPIPTKPLLGFHAASTLTLIVFPVEGDQAELAWGFIAKLRL